MNRYAIIQNGLVINVVIWDGVSNWTPPADTELVQSNTLNVGDNYPQEQIGE